MARQIPSDRLQQLAQVATAVFIKQGYRRTQMADVADAMGLAKGTLYLYVESKEALFDLVCRAADSRDTPGRLPSLPIGTPRPGATAKYIGDRMRREGRWPLLNAAAMRRRAADIRTELTAIVEELYDLLNAHRTAIKLIERCAADYPELAEVWYTGGREAQLALLTAYLDARVRAGQIPPCGDTAIVARVVLENAATWAVHRYWDARPQTVSDAAARATVVDFIVRGLLAAPAQRGGTKARSRR